MDLRIIKALTGSDKCRLTNEKDLTSINPKSFTASISGATEVFNLFPGRVAFIGEYENMATVSVQVSPYEIVRYLNLTDFTCWYNYEFKAGDRIGSVSSKYGLQFEYCTKAPQTSIYPIRIENITYYKQNPAGILFGVYTPEQTTAVTQGLNRPSDTVEFTAEQANEWGGPLVNVINPDVFQVTDYKDIPQAALDMLSNNGGPDE